MFRFIQALGVAVVGLLFVLTASPPHSSAQPSPSKRYPPGWNLVSGTDGSRLIGAVGTIYTLQPGDSSYEEFPSDAPLHGCWGYWAYFPAGGDIALTPGLNLGCLVYPLPGVYAMVGNPSSEYEAQPFNVDPDSTLLYDPIAGYHLATTTIPIGQGAWVINSSAAAANGIRIEAIPHFRPPPACPAGQALTQNGCASPTP